MVILARTNAFSERRWPSSNERCLWLLVQPSFLFAARENFREVTIGGSLQIIAYDRARIQKSDVG